MTSAKEKGVAIGSGKQEKVSSPPKRYFSKRIAERRIRILTEAFALLIDKGIDDFTLKELSQRAGVAEKTLYNNFGSKDEIIAKVFDYFMDSQSQRMEVANPLDIDDIIEKLSVRAVDFFHHREWARASNYLYFSTNSGEKTYRSLRDMTLIYLRPFLETHRDTGSLSAWVPVDMIEMQLANTAHGVAHDWLMNRLDDDLAPRALVFALLTIMVSVTQGELHEAIQERLAIQGQELKELFAARQLR